MSKTISFVASDELADFLEEESERRMTTVSSTAQMLLAEHANECLNQGETDSSDRTEDSEEPGRSSPGGLFERHSEVWYRPSGEKHDYAVEIPEDAGTYDAGGTRYYKTKRGASEALQRWYE